MTLTNRQSGTNVQEVADGIYRINTPVVIPGGGGFSFNQYLIMDDDPLLFHTGPRKMFPLVRDAVASVLRSTGCGTLPCPTWRRTNAARSTNGWPSPRTLCPSAGRWRQWSPSRTWRIGARAPSPTGRCCRWAHTTCAGSRPAPAARLGMRLSGRGTYPDPAMR